MDAENYLYFSGDITADADGLLIPVSKIRGTDYASATTTRIRFEAIPNTAAQGYIDLTHANVSADSDISGKVQRRFLKILANPAKGKTIVVADDVNSVYAEEFFGSSGTSLVTAVSAATITA